MTARFRTLSEALAIQPPKDAPSVTVWCADQPGFGIRVGRQTERGAVKRTWVVSWRADGRQVRENLPVPVSPDRKSWFEAKRTAANRRAAALSLAGRARCPTVREAWEAYKALKGNDLAEATVHSYEQCLMRLGGLETPKVRVQDLRDVALSDITLPMWQHRYQHLRTHRGESSARATMRFAHVLYVGALERREVSENPIAVLSQQVKVYKREPRRQRCVQREDLPRFWRALMQLPGSVRDYVLWVLFTGFRKGLAGALRYDRINERRRTYRIEVKDKGNKAKRPYDFPVPAWLWDNVVAPRLALRKPGEVWLLPSTRRAAQPIHEPRGSLAQIEVLCGVKVSAQDVRRTLSTIAHAELRDAVLVGRMLTHSTRSKLNDSEQEALTSGYIITTEDEIRAAFERTAAAILRYAKVPGHAPARGQRHADGVDAGSDDSQHRAMSLA